MLTFTGELWTIKLILQIIVSLLAKGFWDFFSRGHYNPTLSHNLTSEFVSKALRLQAPSDNEGHKHLPAEPVTGVLLTSLKVSFALP